MYPIPAEVRFDLEGNFHPGSMNMDSPISPHCRRFVDYDQQKTLRIDEATAVILDAARSLVQTIVRKGTGESDSEKAIFEGECRNFWSYLLTLPSAYDEKDDTHRHDLIYETIRLVALSFTKALLDRTPLSITWDLSSLRDVFLALLRLGRNAWDHIPGVLLWVTMTIAPATQEVPIVRAWISSSEQRLGASMGFSDWREFIMSTENFLNYQSLLQEARPACANIQELEDG